MIEQLSLSDASLVSQRARTLAGNGRPSRSLGTSDFAVAAFVDLAQFTTISERLSAQGTSGTESLTSLINSFFDPVIEAAVALGGDVVGFGGDAITVVFDCHPDPLPALSWAKTVQAVVGELDPIPAGEEQLRLRAKVGVGLGTCRTAIIGSGETLREVSEGPAIDAAARAESVLEPGEIGFDGPMSAIGLDGEGTDRSGVTVVDPTAIPDLVSTNSVHEQDRPTGRFDAFVPADVLARARSHGRQMLNEHRPVTVIFVGLDERESAQERFEFLNDAAATIVRNAGTVITLGSGDKGTTVLAAFGAPSARPHQRRDAVNAALELVQSTPCRIGVATGTCFAGQVGAGSRWVYNLMGDPPNMAARLMTSSVSGQVRVDAATRAGLDDSFDFGDVERLQLKGKAGFHGTSLATGVKQQTNALSTELPLVGRGAEFDALQRSYVDAKLTRRGIIEVVGDSGLGKTRLLRELVGTFSDDIEVIWTAGESTSASVQFAPWLRAIRALLSLDSDTGPAEALASVIERAPGLRTVRAQLMRDVLLGALDDSAILQTQDRNNGKELLQSLIADFVREAGSASETTIIIDDAHELDSASQTILSQLSRSLVDTKLTIVVTDVHPDRHRRQVASRIQLKRLSDDDSSNLLTQHSQVSETDILTRQAEAIIRRSGGIPQLIRLFADATSAGTDPEVLDRDTQAIVLSRIDALEPASRSALTVAAVLGQRFPRSDLSGCLAHRAETAQVEALLSQRLLEPGFNDELVFVSQVLREAAYESTSHATRRSLHFDIGEFLELQPNAMTMRVTDLALHFEFTDDAERKHRYLPAAAYHCKRIFDNEAALSWFDKAIAVTGSDRLPELQFALGTTLEHIGDWTRAEQVYREAILSDSSHGIRALASLGRLQQNLGNSSAASETIASAKAAAQTLGDDHTTEWVLDCSSLLASVSGDDEGALADGQEQRTVAARLDDPHREAAALSNIAAARSFLGEPEEALIDFMAAAALLEGKPSTVAAEVQCEIGMTHSELGDQQSAISYLTASIKTASTIGDRRTEAASTGNLALVLSESDRGGAAAEARRAASLILDLGDAVAASSPFGILGMLALSTDVESARVLLARTLKIARRTNTDLYRDRAYGLLAEAYDEVGDAERAAACRSQAERTEDEVTDEEFEFVAPLTDPADSGLDDELVDLLRQADELIANIPTS